MALDDTDINVIPGVSGELAVVQVCGDIDSVNASDVHAAIVEASTVTNSPVILDATGVGFIDAAGLRSLDAARRDIEQGDHRLIVRPSRAITRLSDMCGFDFDLE